MGDRLQSAESEALDFVESMGFMMDNLNFSRLNAADQGKLLKELPVFYADLGAYLPILEQKRDAQGQASLDVISDGEGMAKGRFLEAPPEEYFPRSDMAEAQKMDAGGVPMEAPNFLNQGQSSEPAQVDHLVSEPVVTPEAILDVSLGVSLEVSSLESPALEKPEPPATLSPRSPSLDSFSPADSDDELSEFFQPENITEMVAEIDRTEVPVAKPAPVVERPKPPRKSDPPAPTLPPAKKVQRPGTSVLAPEEKRQFLKLILSI